MAAAAYAVFIEGLAAIDDIKAEKDVIRVAAYRAINRTLDHGRTHAAREMRRQVNFPASYLSPSGGRLTVTQRANKAMLEGRIKGRHRPTSLARFATNVSKQGVTVEVKPGLSKFLPRAFLIKLNAGASRTDTKFNRGLAIRLKPGESLRNKRQAIRMANGLYLLYGPSIDQVFRTVSAEIADDEAVFLEHEFLRLVDLDF